jgi:acetylornithine/N-succinyldiaminopimelate aminotransferase
MQYRPKAMSDASIGKGVGDGVTLAALVVRDAGALVNSPRAGVMRFMPALNVGPAEIDDMVGALGEVAGRVRA